MPKKPDILITTEELAKRLDEPDLRVVEVDVDTSQYEKAHVPGAVGWDWTKDLNHQVKRDLPSEEQFQKLLESTGIAPDTEVVLYGDNDNWFAAFGLWLLQLHGHDKVRLLDGGRQKWLKEGRKTTKEAPSPTKTRYPVKRKRPELRAKREQVLKAVEEGETTLIDVRSPEEFTGEKIAPEGLNETAQRGGHIPGALNVPWSKAVREDGTFRSTKELKELYPTVAAGEPTITYCRIGERSAHSWFVAHHLIGNENVKNYDGSWTEWGNLVDAPIETGQTSRKEVQAKQQ